MLFLQEKLPHYTAANHPLGLMNASLTLNPFEETFAEFGCRNSNCRDSGPSFIDLVEKLR